MDSDDEDERGDTMLQVGVGGGKERDAFLREGRKRRGKSNFGMREGRERDGKREELSDVVTVLPAR